MQISKVDKTLAFITSACQGIATTFQFKPEIKADTTIMGVPAWTLVTSTILFAIWTKYTINKQMNEITELKAKISEIVRDDKESLRRENAELKSKLNVLEDKIHG